MRLLFDVYEHPRGGHWGVCATESQITVVTLRETSFSRKTITPHALGAEVGTRIRQGYVKLRRNKYLHVTTDAQGKETGFFSETHPELGSQRELVLFVALGIGEDMNETSKAWQTLLDETTLSQTRVDQWVGKVAHAQEYVAATKEHPAYALILADWAITHKKHMVGSLGSMPTELPKNAPIEWREWLAQFFEDERLVNEALGNLGWSVADALNFARDASDPQINEDGPGLFSGPGAFVL